MDINYFNEFVTLAETCSFVEAANLHLTISLSKHIKRMEAELELYYLTQHATKISHMVNRYHMQRKSLTQSKYITAIESREAHTKF